MLFCTEFVFAEAKYIGCGLWITCYFYGASKFDEFYSARCYGCLSKARSGRYDLARNKCPLRSSNTRYLYEWEACVI